MKGTHTCTLQLIWLDAQTRASVLQTMVSLPVDCIDADAATVPTALNAVWHVFAVWHTLQPVPVHPVSHEQLEAVKFAKDPPKAARGR